MGNSQPTNQTSKKVTALKLENAKKLGVLSLSGHSLEQIPKQIFEPDLESKLRTLDLSDNKIPHLNPKITQLTELKILNLDNNKLSATTLMPISKLSKLQKLSLAGNRLSVLPTLKGVPAAAADAATMLPELPVSLKEINLASNALTCIPRSIMSKSLSKLEKVDLSNNQLTTVEDIWVLSNLEELRLDSNLLTSLPEAMGTLKKLKVLSLKDNQFRITTTVFNERNPQPLPKSLFTDTPLIDLNLHGNDMTNTQLNEFDGFQDFLDRRQKVKAKTLVNLSVCGLR